MTETAERGERRPGREHVAALERALARWNAGVLEDYLGLYASGAVLHGYPGVEPGIESIRGFYRAFWAAFPGSQLRLEDTVVAGDAVAARATLTAVHGGPFMGLPATGRAVTLPTLTILRFAGGRCVERWSQADFLGLLQQLGAVPPPAGGGAGERPPVRPPLAPGRGPEARGRAAAARRPPEDGKALVRAFVAAADRQDFERATTYLSPQVVVHLAGAPAPLDFPTFFEFGRRWHAAFPDEETAFDDQLAEGDRVVSRMTSTATHRGDFQGLPATGTRITVTGIWFDRIAGGRIAERWGVVDMLGVLQQLGVISPAGPGAPER